MLCTQECTLIFVPVLLYLLPSPLPSLLLKGWYDPSPPYDHSQHMVWQTKSLRPSGYSEGQLSHVDNNKHMTHLHPSYITMPLKTLSLNADVLYSPFKRSLMWKEVLSAKSDIVCIQETHFTASKPPKYSHFFC